jgi:hypothetical protein
MKDFLIDLSMAESIRRVCGKRARLIVAMLGIFEPLGTMSFQISILDIYIRKFSPDLMHLTGAIILIFLASP